MDRSPDLVVRVRPLTTGGGLPPPSPSAWTAPQHIVQNIFKTQCAKQNKNKPHGFFGHRSCVRRGLQSRGPPPPPPHSPPKRLLLLLHRCLLSCSPPDSGHGCRHCCWPPNPQGRTSHRQQPQQQYPPRRQRAMRSRHRRRPRATCMRHATGTRPMATSKTLASSSRIRRR